MKLTSRQLEFLYRLQKWDSEIEKVGNRASQGPFAGYGHAFGKWKPIARRLEDLGLVKFSGWADWFVAGALVYFLTDAGRAVLAEKGREA